MEKELKEKLEGLKLETTGKKPKGCKSCRKKKPVTELPPVIEEEDYIPYIPTEQEILLAYNEINNKDDKSKREFVNKVYRFIFDEDFDFNCHGCVNIQTRKFKNYLNEKLKLNIL